MKKKLQYVVLLLMLFLLNLGLLKISTQATEIDKELLAYDMYLHGSGKNITSDEAIKSDKNDNSNEVLEPEIFSAGVDMCTSDHGIELIKQFEGCVLTAYKAVSTEQYYTIGYGHYGADVYPGMTITQAQADELLKNDLQVYENYVNTFLSRNNITVSQNQFDALTSFTYNLGNVWVSYDTFQLKSYLINGVSNYTADEITTAFTNWCKSGGNVLEGLVKRRKAEAALFLTEDSLPAQVASTTDKVPIICYTLSSQNVNTFTSVNGSYSGYICSYDKCEILEVYSSGWVKVNYPTASGTKTAYAKSSDFFCNTDFSTKTVSAVGQRTVYQKANLTNPLGTVYATDSILIIGISAGNTQILYPISGGYKMGFISGTPYANNNGGESNNSSGGSADRLIEIAKSQLGVQERSVGSDNIIYNDWFYGRQVTNATQAQYAWCAVFVSWCANQAGMLNTIFPKSANTTDTKDRLITMGGKLHLKGDGYTPVKGDIVFFGNNAGEHIGIVDYSSGGYVYYIDGNNVSMSPHGVHYSNCSLNYSRLYGFVTPAYGEDTDDLKRENLGTSFYATIKNISSGNFVTNKNENIISTVGKTVPEQLWKFELQQDGSYKIISCLDGKVLDVERAESANMTNIICCDSNDGSNQRWYLCRNGAGYSLVPAFATGSALDCYGADGSDGANIVLWEIGSGDEAEIYEINKVTDIEPYKATITSAKFYDSEEKNKESYELLEGGTVYMSFSFKNSFGFNFTVVHNDQNLGSAMIYEVEEGDNVYTYRNLAIGTYKFEFTPQNNLGSGKKITKLVTVKSKTPTSTPTPTATPTVKPTVKPTVTQKVIPTVKPTVTQKVIPTVKPTVTQKVILTVKPTVTRRVTPTITRNVTLTATPTVMPTKEPTSGLAVSPTTKVTIEPSQKPENTYSLERADIILSNTYFVYNRKSKQPTVTIILDDIRLKENIDYKVAYKNNTNPGTATITITGIGNYTGSISKTFEITIKDGTIITSNSCKYKIYNDNTATLISVGANLENVTIPNTIKLGNMSFKVRKVAGNVLKDCKKLKTLTLPETVIKLEKDSFIDNSKVTVYILKGAYKYRFDKFRLDGTGSVAVNTPRDKNITNAKIPETVTIAGVRFRITIISKNAFKNCSKLKTITLGNNVSTLGESCFSSCKALTNVTIGTNLNKINKNVFYGDSSLTTIKIKSTKLKTVGASIFKGINGKAVIKVPASKVREYQKLLKGRGQRSGVRIVK